MPDIRGRVRESVDGLARKPKDKDAERRMREAMDKHTDDRLRREMRRERTDKKQS